MKKPFLLLALLVLCAHPSFAAATLISSTVSADAGEDVVLPTDYTGYAKFLSESGGTAVTATDLANVGGFTGLSNADGGYYGGSVVGFTYTDNTGSSPLAVVNDTSYDEGYSNAGGGLEFSSTLFASSETFSLYLQQSIPGTLPDGTVNDVMIEAELENPDGSSLQALSTTTVALPQSGSYNFGELNLTLSGATSGDIVAFTILPTDPSYASVGLEAVGANANLIATPEPATYVLFGVGALLLVARFRSLRRA